MTDGDKDPALEQAFRAQSRETPPPALDAKILAAAHRAVASGPRKFDAEAMRPPRWWMPLAAAAVIGVVAIGVVQLAPNEPVLDTAPTVGSLAKKQKEADQSTLAKNAPAAPAELPAPALAPPAVEAAKPRVAPPPPAPRSNIAAEKKLAAAPTPEPFPASPAPQKTESARDTSKRDAGVAENATQPAPPPAAAPVTTDELRKDVRNERQSAPQAAASPPAPVRERAAARPQSEAPPSAAGAVAAMAQNAAPPEDARMKARDPDAWIARIRKLRDEGQVAEVARELKSFRELVPDAERRLPADLRDWKP